MAVNEQTFEVLGAIMSDESGKIAQRMSTCFVLKQKGGVEALHALAKGLTSKSDLLKHEICYVMGQMRDSNAIPILTNVLKDKSEAPVVRHEAAEALAAIGDLSVLPLLEEYAKDPVREVSETCRLGADGLIYQRDNERFGVSKANSVDPAPAEEIIDVETLQQTLLDTSIPLFKRYRAMFALRDLNSEESVESLALALKDDSALVRHEVCFVMGQMMHHASIEPLKDVLSDTDEHEMVRHEAAEALGNMGTDEIVEFLKPFAKDEAPCVSQSIDVALGMAHFWSVPA